MNWAPLPCTNTMVQDEPEDELSDGDNQRTAMTMEGLMITAVMNDFCVLLVTMRTD